MSSAVEGFPVLGKEVGGVVKGRMRPLARELGESLGVRSGMLPIWTFENPQ